MPSADAALRELGKENVLLGVFDAAFPVSPGEDLGRGSPYSRTARTFLGHVRALGFTGIQLGPQGRTSVGNASPYDGALSEPDELSLSLGDLVERELLGPAERERVVAGAGDVRPRLRAVLEEAGLDAAPCLARQHAALRAHLEELGLTLWGDLPVGMDPADAARWQDLFLPGYRLGAPPSRTNPEGQPWGYPVFHPDRVRPGEDAATSAIAFVRRRARWAAARYDGVRIDHPHGLVCPWVYREDVEDPYHAVRAGARLYSARDLPDHPVLAGFSLVRAEQIDRGVPRFADERVRDLEPAQVERYGVLLAEVVRAFGGPGSRRVACEVLSTRPRPLAAVTERLRLGRFLVTQKADPGDPHDVYRSEEAAPGDWVMVGNHDTPPFWALARAWVGTERGRREAARLARMLRPEAPGALARHLERDVPAFVHAKFSALFASPARNVLVFFTDLYGLEEPYNRPGVVDERNWTLRVPGDGHRPALDLARVLDGALRIRRARSQEEGSEGG